MQQGDQPRPTDPISLDLMVKRTARDAQLGRRRFDSSTLDKKNFFDVLALNLVQGPDGPAGDGFGHDLNIKTQIPLAQELAFAEKNCPLQHVAQLANVTRPRIRLQCTDGAFG